MCQKLWYPSRWMAPPHCWLYPTWWTGCTKSDGRRNCIAEDDLVEVQRERTGYDCIGVDCTSSANKQIVVVLIEGDDDERQDLVPMGVGELIQGFWHMKCYLREERPIRISARDNFPWFLGLLWLKFSKSCDDVWLWWSSLFVRYCETFIHHNTMDRYIYYLVYAAGRVFLCGETTYQLHRVIFRVWTHCPSSRLTGSVHS